MPRHREYASSWMLTKLEVSNYKSIKVLSLEMQPFMVLVGPNGAGKTNVVRALELLGNVLARGTTAPAREQGWAQIVHREKKPARGGLRLGATFHVDLPGSNRSTGAEARVALTLRGKVGDHEISVVSEEFALTSAKSQLTMKWASGKWEAEYGTDPVLWNLLTPSVLGRAVSTSHENLIQRFNSRFGQKELFGDEPTELKLLTRALGPAFHQILRQCSITRLRLDASALRSDARFQVDRDHAIGPSGEGLPVAVDRLRERKEQPASSFLPILQALREVYPRIEDVVPESFGQGRVTLGFRERGIADPIPLDGISDGVLHALALLIALRSPGLGVLAIEEPENALHPWSVRKILELAQTERARQALITTHSETVVNAVQRPESLFIVEADEQHGTTVERATSKERALTAILKESGQKLGDVWLDGSLGGVPLA